MSKWIVLLGIMCSFTIQAHQPDISTTMLVEQADNKWVLQVRASLTAFEYEVHAHYSDSAYATPAEFEALVVNHLKEHIQVRINDQKPLFLKKSQVKLGHETTVVFEISDVPTDINKLAIKNTGFKNIHKSQSALVVFKNGFSKDQFILNASNNYDTQLKVNGNQFILDERLQMGSQSKNIYILVALLLVSIAFLFYSLGRKKEIPIDLA